MKKYKSKTRQEVKDAGLEGEELSKNEELLEELTTDLKKVNVEWKQILKRDNLISKTKKESSRNEKKGNRGISRDNKT